MCHKAGEKSNWDVSFWMVSFATLLTVVDLQAQISSNQNNLFFRELCVIYRKRIQTLLHSGHWESGSFHGIKFSGERGSDGKFTTTSYNSSTFQLLKLLDTLLLGNLYNAPMSNHFRIELQSARNVHFWSDLAIFFGRFLIINSPRTFVQEATGTLDFRGNEISNFVQPQGPRKNLQIEGNKGVNIKHLRELSESTNRQNISCQIF